MMILIEMLSYPFLVRALIVGVLVSLYMLPYWEQVWS